MYQGPQLEVAARDAFVCYSEEVKGQSRGYLREAWRVSNEDERDIWRAVARAAITAAGYPLPDQAITNEGAKST